MGIEKAVALPKHRNTFTLKDARVPLGCMEGVAAEQYGVCIDHLALVDIEVRDGIITSILPAGGAVGGGGASITSLFFGPASIHLHGKMVLPTFVDLHTHIDKGHSTERSRNPNGSLSGADRSTAADAAFWDADDVFRRMDFSIRCAYAHGTSALRTHLINMSAKQRELTWPAFAKLRQKWRGKVDVQGVSLVVLSFFRDAEAARKLADTVAEHGGLLGAAVCCAEQGGDPSDDWTTCEGDRGELLDRIFTLAKERDLDIDFHTDENGNEMAKGLRYVAEKTIEHGYQGRVVCGHCCSLAYQLPEELEKTLALAAAAGITVVCLPLVNQWTQDRDHNGGRTPRWRGITLLHETRAAGVPVAIASDNTRDQFYAYGDLDMLEVFTQGCRMAHLDRPYGDWVRCVTSTPANAMGLPEQGRLAVGGSADFVIFRGRRYSELLSRPQMDRVVVRGGWGITAVVPDYSELDYVPLAIKSGEVAVMEVDSYLPGAQAVVDRSVTRLGDPRMAAVLANGGGKRGRSAVAGSSSSLMVSSSRGMGAVIVALLAALLALFFVSSSYGGVRTIFNAFGAIKSL